MSTLDTNRIEYEQALANLLSAYGDSSSGTIGTARLSLINYVKAKLDEVIPEGEGIQFAVEEDKNISDPLSLLINAILNESAKRVLLNAPLSVIHPVKSNATATPDATDSNIGTIVLPDNFLRFVSLKMADWKQPISKAISITDEKYKLQANKFVRGGTAKPVVAIRTSASGYGMGVAQVDKIIFDEDGTDAGNQGLVSCAGLEFELIFDTDLETTMSEFVTENAVDFASVGVTLTSSGATLIFTAATPGTPFESPTFYNTEGDGFIFTIEHTTPNRPIILLYNNILEYYSVKDSHTIDYLYYVQETAAEDVQSNLHDAMSWMAAGMILQITERVDLAKTAFEQEQASYNNL